MTSFAQNNAFQNLSQSVLSFVHSLSLLNAVPHMNIISVFIHLLVCMYVVTVFANKNT